jgi:hypothetical protein
MTKDEHIAALTAQHCHPENMRWVKVEVLPDDVLDSCTKTENESFFNSYMNVIYQRGDRYVLGFRCDESQVIDCAIIRRDGRYFDPTAQANEVDFKPYDFAILTEFSVFDVMRKTKSNKDFPPDVDYLRSHLKQYKNVLMS